MRRSVLLFAALVAGLATVPSTATAWNGDWCRADGTAVALASNGGNDCTDGNQHNYLIQVKGIGKSGTTGSVCVRIIRNSGTLGMSDCGIFGGYQSAAVAYSSTCDWHGYGRMRSNAGSNGFQARGTWSSYSAAGCTP